MLGHAQNALISIKHKNKNKTESININKYSEFACYFTKSLYQTSTASVTYTVHAYATYTLNCVNLCK
jgi:hypothetical protein